MSAGKLANLNRSRNMKMRFYVFYDKTKEVRLIWQTKPEMYFFEKKKKKNKLSKK
jgi:hypothetical protein